MREDGPGAPPPGEEAVLRHLAGAAAGCPSENLLAGFEEGRLLPEERLYVEDHLTRCPDCALLVGRRAATDAGRTSRGRIVRLALAAAAVLAVALLVRSLAGGSRGGNEERLRAAASDVERARPDLFAGFRPLTSAERLALDERAVRGAGAQPVLHLPQGTVLEDRPAFSFTLPLGLGASRVELLTPDGRVIWSSPAPTVARRGIVSVPLSEGAPALERGRSFLWRVAWPQGTVTEKFQVASDEQRRAWEEAVRTVEARVDVELRPLVLAHAALRRGLWGEADRWTRALEPADDVRRETIEAVRRRLQLGGTP